MRKGWRNDPKWVEHYSAVAQKRIERQIARMKAEAQMSMLNEDMRRSLQKIQKVDLAWGRI